ncbi:MAG TPA: hypothetical protein VFE07_07280 [Marmoricola sp.]|nr:hypothetical protein [Marmoricola sp.]
MAEVSIDVQAMASLVSSLEGARGELTGAASTVRGNLSRVWLSCDALTALDYGGTVEAWIDDGVRDLNRRLSMARLIQQSTPGLSVVTFDDSILSNADPAEVQRRVDRVLELMKVDEDDFGKPRDIDPELLALLDQNALDPYFAKALAEKLDPDALRKYLYGTNRGRADVMRQGEDAVKAFDEKYDALLSGLGTSLGLASKGTGALAVPGMTKQWTDFITDKGRYRGTGAVNALSLVIERGQWSDDFVTGVYHAIRSTEGGEGSQHWAVGGFDQVFDPDLDKSPGCHLMNDPMYGVLKALQSSPGATARLFTGGETTTISAGGKDVAVNKELWDLVHERGGLDEDSIQAFTDAMTAAIGSPPVPGQTAFQPLLANDLKNIGQALQDEAKKAEEEAGPWWSQLGHGLLDLVGLIPVLGEPADFVNGVWYYADGKPIDGSLSMASMIPFAGWAVSGGKWVRRGLKAEELAELSRLARDGKLVRVFGKDGKLLENVDLTDPANFSPDRFLSPAELKRWSGSREFMQKVIAGNRFNYFLNPRYTYSEIPLATRNKLPFRLDSYTPGQAIVSRKLTQFGDITEGTAKGYIDEFVKKYPVGTRIADTAKTRELGIAGQKLDGPMILEVPPQLGGRIDPDIVKYAESKRIYIRDLNGTFYTRAPR